MILATAPLAAQESAPPGSDTCDCAAQLEALVETIERVYVALPVEILPDREEAYRAHVRTHRIRARLTPDEECYELLDAYVGWFGDPHLHLIDGGRAHRDDTAADVERIALDEGTLRQYLASADRLDPIEGLWYDGADRIGVMRLPTARRDFAGIYLEGAREGWEPGMVAAEFRGRADGSYRVSLRDVSFRLRRQTAGVWGGGDVLRLSPGIWGRVEAAGRTLAPVDVHRAHLWEYEPDVLVITLPSLDPSHRGALDSIVDTHGDELAAAEVVIVDLRGNEGGSSWVGDALIPFMGPREEEPEGGGPRLDSRVALSSPEIEAYFERLIAQIGTVPEEWSTLRARLAANPGEVVPLADRPTPAPERGSQPERFASGPTHLALLIDGGVVSAGEAVTLTARRRERVTVFGEATGGSIDYQNTTGVRVGCRDEGMILLFPTMAASADLPEGGHNRTGVLPDVPMDAGSPDLFDRIVAYYRGG